MKAKKSAFYFVLWAIITRVGSTLSVAEQILYFLDKKDRLKFPPYTILQSFLLWGVLPFCLIPLLYVSNRLAVREKNRAILILSTILLIHHIICLIALLVQAIWI